MKTILISILAIAQISIFAQPNNVEIKHSMEAAEISEEAKIVKLLKDETTAYYSRDYQGVIDGWIQDDDSVIAWNKKKGGYAFIRGWEGINDYYKRNTDKTKERTHPDFNVGDLKIEISGNLAYVIYNEYAANKDNMYSRVPGVKTLKKVKGAWKLHSVISFWDYDYKYSKSEVIEFTRATGFEQYK